MFGDGEMQVIYGFFMRLVARAMPSLHSRISDTRRIELLCQMITLGFDLSRSSAGDLQKMKVKDMERFIRENSSS